ncbi:MAG TPA: hypothetical protein VN932_10830 [Rhizomicrobium sp.]|nr:hypothetical protein [Rhizomicrobium sp.]
MSVADISVWAGFFAIVAQIGATLAGLLFVGLTISLGHVLAARGYLARAFAALFLQLNILLLGLFGLVPGQPPAILGAEFIVTGLALLAGISAFSRNFPEDGNSAVLGSGIPRVMRTVLMLCGTLFPVASGIALIAGWHGALYLLVPGIVACVYPAVGYAWVFAVEIPRRKQGETDF